MYNLYYFTKDTFLDKYSLAKKGTQAKIVKDVNKREVIITLLNDPFNIKYVVKKELLNQHI